MGWVTSKEKHCSSYKNPGSETARQLRSRNGCQSNNLQTNLLFWVYIFYSIFCQLALKLPPSQAAVCDVFGDIWTIAI